MISALSSSLLTRSTTGTEVQGRFPRSVITMATWSGDVTSYTKFSTANEFTSFQSAKCLVVPSHFATSAGSPEKGGGGGTADREGLREVRNSGTYLLDHCNAATSLTQPPL